MKKRFLRYAAADVSPLRVNEVHNFAHRFANHLYAANAIYTLIPKNACSTMRLSLAIENGCIRDESGINWTHRNNGTFKPSLRELIVADYTFVILRCPFARLASCFLDKFMFASEPFKIYREALASSGSQQPGITFKSFCLSLRRAPVLRADMHWQPQHDFLVYDGYDDYFSVETLAADSLVIARKTGMKIVDARHLTRHGLLGVELLPDDEYGGDVPLQRHRTLRQRGAAYHPRSLYDEETRAAVADIYGQDLALFDRHFPGKGLFARESAGTS